MYIYMTCMYVFLNFQYFFDLCYTCQMKHPPVVAHTTPASHMVPPLFILTPRTQHSVCVVPGSWHRCKLSHPTQTKRDLKKREGSLWVMYVYFVSKPRSMMNCRPEPPQQYPCVPWRKARTTVCLGNEKSRAP